MTVKEIEAGTGNCSGLDAFLSPGGHSGFFGGIAPQIEALYVVEFGAIAA